MFSLMRRSVITRNSKLLEVDVAKELTFNTFKLMPELVSVLNNSLKIQTPSPVQQLAIPHLIQGKSAMVGAQTGTGKTLTYALPLMHRLKMGEMQSGRQMTEPNRPRALILVPNRELVQQVLSVTLKPFCYEVPLKHFGLWPGQNHQIETEKLNSGIDCLVSTVDRLQHRRDGNKVFLSNIETLVIDEFDTFVDCGQTDNIKKLLDQYLAKGPRQVIFASATVNKQMRALTAEYFQSPTSDPSHDFKEIIEKSTHMNLSNLNHEFIHIADYDKIKPLKLLIKEFKKYARKHNTSAIVFCNSVQSARAIEHALSEEGLKTASMHGDIPPKLRERNFDKFKQQEAQVLVATDLASRGLDIPFVSHIINFDFPKTNSDYLHRAGRAGRAGREGFVLSMYREKDMPILEAMKQSYSTLEPLKIEGGSAYSIRQKDAKLVSLGAKKDQDSSQKLIADKSKNAVVKKEKQDRILKMRLKPTKPQKTSEDIPRPKKGRNWRG